MGKLTLSLDAPPELVTHFDRALYHLQAATRIDETIAIRDQADQLKLLGRQAKDKTLQADAAELAMRAERKLGILIAAAKEAGQLAEGRPKKRSGGEQFPQLRLDDIGVDRKLSSKAQSLARSPEAIFEDVVRQAREKILAGKAIVINPTKDVTSRQKKVMRAIKEAQLAAKARALPKDVYQLIYADPEWKFETWSEEGLDRAADNHYPTSDLAAIKARPVGTLAAKDCVLFMWVTAPFHAAGHGAAVMRYWGFEPKAEWIWDKVDQATGYWNRNQHEVLIVGVRGSVPAPAPGTQWPSVIRSRPGAHSEKPDWAYELIEAHFPNLKRIELNARRRRDGWDAWGYEAPEDESELSAGAEGARQLDGEPKASFLALSDPLRSGAATRKDAGDASVGGEGERQTFPATPFPAAAEGSSATGVADVGGSGEAHAREEPGITGGAEVTAAPPVSPTDINDVIREGYARNAPLDELAAATGLSENAVKQRAKRMGIGDRTRQREAAKASALRQPRDGGKFAEVSP